MNASAEAANWIQILARLGYFAKGVVYLLVGGLALRSATSTGGRTEDSSGAIRSLLDEPFGEVFLVAIGVGLLGYMLWRIVQALLDPEHEGGDAKGIATRAAYLISGVLYAALAIEAFRLGLGSSSGGSGGSSGGGADHWTAMAMQQPLGRWAVGLVGLGLIAFALYEFRKAVTADIDDRLDLSELGATGRSWVVRIGRAGLAARGVVFVLIGWFLIRAAVQQNPSEAGGLEEALETLQGQAYGPWLLGLVAAGLVAYGLFQIVKGRYRLIRAR